MKYISLDTETTGLDFETCQLLSVGVIIEDSNNPLPFEKLPKFHAIIIRDFIQGEPFALDMNKDIITLINTYNNSNIDERYDLSAVSNVTFTTEESLVRELRDFLNENNFHGKITIAGKNYNAFDKLFLQKLPNWKNLNIHRRVIDPATPFVDWTTDKEMPSLDTCKQRAGIQGEVTHDALQDAWDVIQILRTKY